ncbi:MAG: Uma2 family endonuclease [Microcystaceae cyanobacterium]
MTITPIKQQLTLEEFVTHLPDEEGRYELVNGEIMRILPTRKHETLAEAISDLLKSEVKRLQLNYWISGRVMIGTHSAEGKEQGRQPDVTVVDKTIWEAYPSAYSALLEPPQLVVEVVSTNWENDYVDKLDEYQHLGIPEYWIVDYLAVGSRDYLGNPKEPAIFICTLDNNQYKIERYRGEDSMISPTFPELKMTVQDILAS